MQQQGLDPSKLSITNVAPPARGAMLLSGKVPAIEFFVLGEIYLTHSACAKFFKNRVVRDGFPDHGFLP